MMPHRTNLVLLGVGLLVVLVAGVFIGTDAGGVRTHIMLAMDGTPVLTSTRRFPLATTRDPDRGLPTCGRVYPACETWAPERLEAMLDDNPRCEVAYVWAALAYRKQRNWVAFWATCDEIDEVWSNHHFPAAMRTHHAKLGIPAPR